MVHETAQIHPTAIIYPNTEIGANTIIGPYCIIGAPPEHRAIYPSKGKGVKIGQNCVLHGHCTVDAGTERKTFISNRVWLMKGAHVGHDAIIGDDSTLACRSLIGGHTEIASYCNIGLGAAIHQRVKVPAGVMLGMNSTITKTTPLKAFHKYAGSPAKSLGFNIVLAERLELSLSDIGLIAE